MNQGVEFNNQYNQARLKSQSKKDPLATRLEKNTQFCFVWWWFLKTSKGEDGTSKHQRDPEVAAAELCSSETPERKPQLATRHIQVRCQRWWFWCRCNSFIDRVKYQKASGHQGSSSKTSMKLSKTNLKQLQRANQGSNHPDKNYTLEKFLSQTNKSEVE